MINKIAVFADSEVGFGIVKNLIDQFRDDLKLVVTVGENEIRDLCHKAGISSVTWGEESNVIKHLNQAEVELGILAWWPKIISSELLGVPQYGFVNTHNSLLPHCRGKQPYFWSIVEERPYGVTIHQVDEGIDTGKIVAQRQIRYDWEDNAGTIYEKALDELVALFSECYPTIKERGVVGREQGDFGSFHLGKELDGASEIDLEKKYAGRELINIIRARTTKTDFPGAFFKDGDDIYEIKLNIKKLN